MILSNEIEIKSMQAESCLTRVGFFTSLIVSRFLISDTRRDTFLFLNFKYVDQLSKLEITFFEK